MLSLLNPELCIGCGCCSYVCPSRINIMQSVLEAKDAVLSREVKKEDNGDEEL
ncbi:MAG: 4Fe-4S binding protein [Clostridia bacterium]|nr:4Fe-4S binding protein [Clostridia bacterium]